MVRWTAKIEPAVAVKAGGDLEVVLDARIDPGWHLYAITQEKGGPQALVIAVPPASAFRLTGPVIAPLPIAAPDANFNIETQYHAEEATLLRAAGGARRRVWPDAARSRCHVSDLHRPLLSAADDRTRQPVAARARHWRRRDRSWRARGARSPARPRAVVEDMADVDRRQHARRLPRPRGVDGRAVAAHAVCVSDGADHRVRISPVARSRTGGRAVSQALVYGLGIVLTFTGAGAVLAVGFGASGLNQFAANPWLNLGITALFIAFALNLFGVFELALPSSLLTRASAADSGRGRYAGTLLMGLAFTLTSFTCTAPFLGTLLVVASQGDWQWPLGGLLAFSSVFALPFVALALAPQAIARAAALGQRGCWP